MNSFNRNTAPVKEGEEFDVKVESIGDKGDGVVRVKGFVLFVPNVKKGEDIRIKVTKVLSKVGFAEKVGEASAKDAQEAQPEQAQDESYEDSDDFGEEETSDDEQ